MAFNNHCAPQPRRRPCDKRLFQKAEFPVGYWMGRDCNQLQHGNWALWFRSFKFGRRRKSKPISLNFKRGKSNFRILQQSTKIQQERSAGYEESHLRSSELQRWTDCMSPHVARLNMAQLGLSCPIPIPTGGHYWMQINPFPGKINPWSIP